MALSKILLLSCFLLVALVLVSNVVAEEAEEQLKGEEVLDTDQYGGYPGRGYGGYPGRGYGGYPGRGYGGYPGRGYGGYPGRGYPGRGGYRCRYGYCRGRCCAFAEVQGKPLP